MTIDRAEDWRGFGAALRMLRKGANFTMGALASRLGVSVEAISALERGEHPPGWQWRPRVRDASGWLAVGSKRVAGALQDHGIALMRDTQEAYVAGYLDAQWQEEMRERGDEPGDGA